MLGKMQDWPLQVWRLLDHAATNHGAREIVSMTVEGPTVRTNWAEVAGRARRVAQALHRLGMQPGDRLATLAWNTHRHLECWYGISGMGGVAHTINPRLFQDQIVYIANHAGDRVLFFDASFLKLVEEMAPRLTTIEKYIVLTDREHMPAGSTLDLLCYEELVGAEDGQFHWVELDENAPCGMCYTSGTTGNPKGVVYTHRSNVLHAWAACMGDVFGLTAQSIILPFTPMYHANAWSVPYAAALAGAKLVFAGPHTDAPTIHALIVEENVDFTLAVPTVWLAMLQHLEKTGGHLGKLKRVAIGGSAVPRMMIERFQNDYGVAVAHIWGMTEMSPLGTAGSPCPAVAAMEPEARLDAQCKQGRAVFGVEMKIVDGRRQRTAARRQGVRAAAGQGAVDRRRILPRRRRGRCSTATAGSIPATSRRSIR